MTATCPSLSLSVASDKEDSLTLALCVSYTVHYLLLATILVVALCVSTPTTRVHMVDLRLLPLSQPGALASRFDSGAKSPAHKPALKVRKQSVLLRAALPTVSNKPTLHRDSQASKAPPTLVPSLAPESAVLPSASDSNQFLLHINTPVQTSELTAPLSSASRSSTSASDGKPSSDRDSDPFIAPVAEKASSQSQVEPTVVAPSAPKVMLPTIAPLRASPTFGAVRSLAVLPSLHSGPGGDSVPENQRYDWPCRVVSACSADIDFGPYFLQLRRQIKSTAYAPAPGQKVVVQFDVNRSGIISNPHVVETTGTASGDAAAIAAMQFTSPLRPLPAGAPDTVTLELTMVGNGYEDIRTKPAPGMNERYVLACGPDFSSYMADLSRRIRQHWYPPKDGPSGMIAAFRVNSDGSIADLKLSKSTGSQICNEAALKAVQDAVPFKPLPAGSPEFITIDFTFDYSLFAQERSLPR